MQFGTSSLSCFHCFSLSPPFLTGFPVCMAAHPDVTSLPGEQLPAIFRAFPTPLLQPTLSQTYFLPGEKNISLASCLFPEGGCCPIVGCSVLSCFVALLQTVCGLESSTLRRNFSLHFLDPSPHTVLMLVSYFEFLLIRN